MAEPGQFADATLALHVFAESARRAVTLWTESLRQVGLPPTAAKHGKATADIEGRKRAAEDVKGNRGRKAKRG